MYLQAAFGDLYRAFQILYFLKKYNFSTSYETYLTMLILLSISCR